MAAIGKLRETIRAMTLLADAGQARWFTEGRDLLAALLREDDWLPDAFAEPGPTYRQYLLHCDPLERFSMVSFVWGPGQRTPVHNHLTWGLVGMLRGEEVSTNMHRDGAGRPMRAGQVDHLRPGEVVCVEPGAEHIHVVENAFADRTSISIHVYGGNIGAIERQVFDPGTGAARAFVSGYTAAVVPNLWDRSGAA
jgi:3-mercaptopropionate dioxygenase